MEAVTGFPMSAATGAGGTGGAVRLDATFSDLDGDAAETGGRSPPPRALAISGLSLLAAVVVGIAWPRSVAGYSGFVWILALVPLFLLSYYRGWKGAALASVTAMLALVAVELVMVRMAGRAVDWRVLGSVTGLLILVTLGAGWLSEILIRQRSLAMRMAYRDPLTGLANRRLLREHADRDMARADREEGVQTGLIFMDLIRFKRINDDLGHHAGDEALNEVASRLQAAMRDSDTVARVGGDEFAVLLTGELDVQDVVSVAQRIEERISLPFVLEGETVRQRARVGVAVYPQHASGFDQLLSHADPGKRVGGTSSEHEVVVCSPLQPSGPGDASLEEGLRRAVHRGPDGGELTVHYQPVVSVADADVAGAEALVRWHHPDSGLLKAARFITVAEYAGLVRAIEVRVLQDAVRWASRWSEREAAGWVSVNLSPVSFQDPAIVERTDELLREHGVPGRRLVVELAEQADLRHPDAVAEVAHGFRELGVRLAVDDFGSADASVGRLECLPVEFLKIDPGYVGALGRDARRERLVEGVIGLGRGLGAELIAEGVEERRQYEWLRDHGVGFFQGHLRGKPVPPEQFDWHEDGGRAHEAVG